MSKLKKILATASVLASSSDVAADQVRKAVQTLVSKKVTDRDLREGVPLTFKQATALRLTLVVFDFDIRKEQAPKLFSMSNDGTEIEVFDDEEGEGQLLVKIVK